MTSPQRAVYLWVQCCISCFSVVEIKYHDQGTLQKNEFLWNYSSTNSKKQLWKLNQEFESSHSQPKSGRRRVNRGLFHLYTCPEKYSSGKGEILEPLESATWTQIKCSEKTVKNFFHSSYCVCVCVCVLNFKGNTIVFRNEWEGDETYAQGIAIAYLITRMYCRNNLLGTSTASSHQ